VMPVAGSQHNTERLAATCGGAAQHELRRTELSSAIRMRSGAGSSTDGRPLLPAPVPLNPPGLSTDARLSSDAPPFAAPLPACRVSSDRRGSPGPAAGGPGLGDPARPPAP